MYHALHVYSDVRIFNPLNALSAAMAMRKERERVACDLIEDRIVVPARKGHSGFRSRARAERPTLRVKAYAEETADAGP